VRLTLSTMIVSMLSTSPSTVLVFLLCDLPVFLMGTRPPFGLQIKDQHSPFEWLCIVCRRRFTKLKAAVCGYTDHDSTLLEMQCALKQA